MKNMRLSMRLFLSFAIILLLLIAVVGSEYNSINNLKSRNEKMLTTVKIKENADLAKSWTLDYYDTLSSISISNVESSCDAITMTSDDASSIFKKEEDLNIIKDIKSDAVEYYSEFNEFIKLVDQNDAYFNEMVNSVKGILLEFESISLAQVQDYNIVMKKAKINIDKSAVTDSNSKVLDPNSVAIDFVSIYEQQNELLVQMENEYNEVLRSSEAVSSIHTIMTSELRYLNSKDSEFDDAVYQNIKDLKSSCTWLKENFDSDKDKTSITRVEKRIDDFVVSYEAYKELLRVQEDKKKELIAIIEKIVNSSDTIKYGQEEKMAMDIARSITVSLFIGIISVVLGILFALYITRNIVSQITKNIDGLSKSSNRLEKASAQLSDAGQQLSEGSTEQSASIEQTSATMSETSTMVKQTAKNTGEAYNLSKETESMGQKSLLEMEEMINSMDELEKSSNDISNIIKVIENISFQTNMLALNAGVEAARAGDAGLGFAVVAEEVRTLAQKSAKAAKDTVEIIDRNIQLSNKSSAISGKANDTLGQIIEKAKASNILMDEISTASIEQAKGTDQVAIALGQMETIVQKNAVTAEESAESASELQVQAQLLSNIIDDLNKIITGSNKKGRKIAKIEELDFSEIVTKIKQITSHTNKRIDPLIKSIDTHIKSMVKKVSIIIKKSDVKESKPLEKEQKDVDINSSEDDILQDDDEA